jgi:NAD+ diphosphatase
MNPSEQHPNPFSGAHLDRRAEQRAAADWVNQALADPDCRFVVGSGLLLLARVSPPGAALLLADAPLVRQATPDQLVLLGWFRGRRCVLVEAPAGATPPADTSFQELRPLLGVIADDEAALLHAARGLLFWRSRHRHCGVCGSATAPRSAGHALRCTDAACAAEYFPRIDPAIIVLVTDGEYLLLGRQASWPPGRYSALAGFVEVGESLEDAVVREVYEEVGVRVSTVQYFASQPWPFPSSLMVGFLATAPRGALTLDGELEDARWHHVSEVTGAAPHVLPPPFTIARRLIDAWLRQVGGQSAHAAL